MIRFRIIGLALGVLLSGSLAGCQSDNRPQRKPGPIIEIYGVMPEAMGMRMGIAYTSLSDEKRCKQFTARNMGYVPMQVSKTIWGIDRSQADSLDVDRGDTIVPPVKVDTPDSTSERLPRRNKFKWQVDAGWKGEGSECEMSIFSISYAFFFKDKNDYAPLFENLGGVAFEVNASDQNNWKYSDLKNAQSDTLRIRCENVYDSIRGERLLGCDPIEGTGGPYKLGQIEAVDTVVVNVVVDV